MNTPLEILESLDRCWPGCRCEAMGQPVCPDYMCWGQVPDGHVSQCADAADYGWRIWAREVMLALQVAGRNPAELGLPPISAPTLLYSVTAEQIKHRALPRPRFPRIRRKPRPAVAKSGPFTLTYTDCGRDVTYLGVSWALFRVHWGPLLCRKIERDTAGNVHLIDRHGADVVDDPAVLEILGVAL